MVFDDLTAVLLVRDSEGKPSLTVRKDESLETIQNLLYHRRPPAAGDDIDVVYGSTVSHLRRISGCH